MTDRAGFAAAFDETEARLGPAAHPRQQRRRRHRRADGRGDPCRLGLGHGRQPGRRDQRRGSRACRGSRRTGRAGTSSTPRRSAR
ncbi:MAG: hypothetical protein WDN24_06235 [Sphingomonas sp.]